MRANPLQGQVRRGGGGAWALEIDTFLVKWHRALISRAQQEVKLRSKKWNYHARSETKDRYQIVNYVKGAQAWDIRRRVFYTNQTCPARWLGDWRKNMAFRKLEPLFEGFRYEYLI